MRLGSLGPKKACPVLEVALLDGVFELLVGGQIADLDFLLVGRYQCVETKDGFYVGTNLT